MRTNYEILSQAGRLREGANRFLIELLRKDGLGDVTAACGDVFHALFEGGPATLSDLALKIRRAKATTSVMVDRLERLGYVEKRPRMQDRRSLEVALTAKGESFRSVMDGVAERLNEKILEDFTEAEAAELERLLKKAVGNFRFDAPEKL